MTNAAVPARNGRSETEILARSGLPIVLGEEVWRVRPRTINANRAWQEQVKNAIGGALENLDETQGVAEVMAMIGASTDTLLDLVIAYDDAGVLPEREWINGHATDHEVLDALVLLLEQSFPFFDVGRKMLPPEMRGLVISRVIAAFLYDSARSTSAPSQPGASGAQEN